MLSLVISVGTPHLRKIRLSPLHAKGEKTIHRTSAPMGVLWSRANIKSSLSWSHVQVRGTTKSRQPPSLMMSNSPFFESFNVTVLGQTCSAKMGQTGHEASPNQFPWQHGDVQQKIVAIHNQLTSTWPFCRFHL